MVEGVLERGPEWIACGARLDPGSPFAGLGRPDGRAPSWVAIEMAAQAAAALELGEPAASRGPWLGYLVRLRGVRCRRPELPVGATVRLEVTRRTAVATLRTYEVLASVDGEELLSAGLSLFFEPVG
jgi:predicted hotdog family 3-hydroxylacyl-ACP dehydratase